MPRSSCLRLVPSPPHAASEAGCADFQSAHPCRKQGRAAALHENSRRRVLSRPLRTQELYSLSPELSKLLAKMINIRLLKDVSIFFLYLLKYSYVKQRGGKIEISSILGKFQK